MSCLEYIYKTTQDISYLKNSWALNIPIHSKALLEAILCWLVHDSVGITSSFLLLVFPLSVSLALLRLPCLYFSVELVTVQDYS